MHLSINTYMLLPSIFFTMNFTLLEKFLYFLPMIHHLLVIIPLVKPDRVLIESVFANCIDHVLFG